MRLDRAIDHLEGRMAREGRTKASRTKYCHDVLPKFADVVGPDALCSDVTELHCETFLDRYVNHAPATLALHTSIVNVFCDHCLEKGWMIQPGPMVRIHRPPLLPAEDLDVVTVSSEDVGRLFAACQEIDEFLCVAVLVYTGGRRTAAANLRWRDLDFHQGLGKFREKGRKTNALPLADELREILYQIGLEGRVPAAPDDYVIPNRHSGRAPGGEVTFRSMAGRRRSNKVVYKLITQVGERAGIIVHPHALRAAFAVAFDEQPGTDLLALKELLGHARVETTEIYLRRRDKAKAKEQVRGLSWASQLQSSSLLPPAGFEPALQERALPDPIRAKLDELRARQKAVSKKEPRGRRR
jgi:integrase